VPVHLVVVTPERPVVDLEVDTVVCPGSEGQFQVLPEHEALLAPLRPGIVRYEVGGREHRLAVSGGFAEVTQERVTLLARSAELPEEIDRARAEASRDRAEQALREAGATAPVDRVEQLSEAMARAEARLELAD
jgi:F-type H+-transporting ATPase subunit epsilon